mmetsp:Transcript_13469/g.24377  ORF Transcript_13469/g.24377 Transcript_13469/m.24377 type:complete len:257 (-) Transcript_13469:1149-1919(-)
MAISASFARSSSCTAILSASAAAAVASSASCFSCMSILTASSSASRLSLASTATRAASATSACARASLCAACSQASASSCSTLVFATVVIFWGGETARLGIGGGAAGLAGGTSSDLSSLRVPGEISSVGCLRGATFGLLSTSLEEGAALAFHLAEAARLRSDRTLPMLGWSEDALGIGRFWGGRALVFFFTGVWFSCMAFSFSFFVGTSLRLRMAALLSSLPFLLSSRFFAFSILSTAFRATPKFLQNVVMISNSS